MKVKLGNLDPNALARARGLFAVYWGKNGPHIQTWPQPGKRKRTKQQIWWEEQFALAARMAANPIQLDYETAVEIVKGTTMVPRDALTAAAYGRQYEIISPDGTQWPVADHGLPPDPVPPTPPEEDMAWEWSIYERWTLTTVDATSAATKGIRFVSSIPLRIRGVRALLNATLDATLYRASVVTLTPLNAIASVVDAQEILTPVGAYPMTQWELDASVPAGTNMAVLITRAEGSPTSSIPLRRLEQAWHIPVINSQFVTAASIDPDVGVALTNGTGNGAAIGILL